MRAVLLRGDRRGSGRPRAVTHPTPHLVSRLIHPRRREPNSPWRKLGCFKQALLVLAHPRKNEAFAQVVSGSGVSEATAWRYVDETLGGQAAWAPGPHEALVGLGEGDFVIVDGTLIPADSIKADEPYYSQKHKQHGMNVQVIAAPDGTPLWFSRAAPGRTHDLTAARAHGIVQACRTRQILVLADRAYQGAGATVRTPCCQPVSPRPRSYVVTRKPKWSENTAASTSGMGASGVSPCGQNRIRVVSGEM